MKIIIVIVIKIVIFGCFVLYYYIMIEMYI